LQFLG